MPIMPVCEQNNAFQCIPPMNIEHDQDPTKENLQGHDAATHRMVSSHLHLPERQHNPESTECTMLEPSRSMVFGNTRNMQKDSTCGKPRSVSSETFSGHSGKPSDDTCARSKRFPKGGDGCLGVGEIRHREGTCVPSRKFDVRRHTIKIQKLHNLYTRLST